MLNLGYRRYQNDIFWLLMGFRMRDQGVRRIYAGSRDDACGHTWDIIQPSFENGFGFSPNDQYSVWVLGGRHVTPVGLELGFFSVLVSRLRAAAGALFPPKGEEKEKRARSARG